MIVYHGFDQGIMLYDRNTFARMRLVKSLVLRGPVLYAEKTAMENRVKCLILKYDCCYGFYGGDKKQVTQISQYFVI